MQKESEQWMHQPIVQKEIMDFFQIKAHSVLLDCTAGEGGHSEFFFQNMQGGVLLLIDRDLEILNRAKKRLENLQEERKKKFQGNPPEVLFERANFSNLQEILEKQKLKRIDYLLYDLGVSLYHFRKMGRGFSLNDSKSLDMRLELNSLSLASSSSITAKEIVNSFSENKLAEIFKNYGEEPKARGLARHIVKKRQRSKVETAYQLKCWIEEFFNSFSRPASSFVKPSNLKSRSSKKYTKNKQFYSTHPATQSFQALRIFVNQELMHIEKGLEIGIEKLASGGKIAILSFHSLEDRLVKKVLRKYSSDCICPKELPFCHCEWKPKIRLFSKKPTQPTPLEIRSNPRARSAQLRLAVKL